MAANVNRSTSMDRRTLLAMIPLLTTAVALSQTAAPVVEAAPLDTRPSFNLSDFVLWAPEHHPLCPHDGVDHGVYTHGCVPVAFLRTQLADSAATRPATSDAIPADAFQDCPYKRLGGPHQHHDFRWSA